MSRSALRRLLLLAALERTGERVFGDDHGH